MAAVKYAFVEKTLVSILNAINEGIFIIGPDGTVLEANDAVLSLHQVSRDE